MTGGTNFEPDFTQLFHNITDHRRGEYKHVRGSGNVYDYLIIKLFTQVVFPFRPEFRSKTVCSERQTEKNLLIPLVKITQANVLHGAIGNHFHCWG